MRAVPPRRGFLSPRPISCPMTSGDSLISVNFAEPFPLFPLSATMLMPHGIVPLRIFEPRYKQMVADALDGPKQFAMATFRGEQWIHEYHGRPAIRPVVCLGQIMQHMQFEDGTYAIVVQGLCRATVIEELDADEELLYRRAILKPLDVDHPDEGMLESFRHRITEALETDRLADLRGAPGILEHLRNNDIPTSVLIEVLGFQFLADPELRYKLLASDDVTERADIVQHELMNVQRLLRRAQPQRKIETPKGCHWN
jgi:Lon protease-like protein